MYTIKEKITLTLIIVAISSMFLLSIGMLINYGYDLITELAKGIASMNMKGF